MSRQRELALIAGAAGLSLAAAMLLRRRAEDLRRSDDAPGRTARRLDFGGYRVDGRTVTISASRADIYAQWRDPARLNRIFGGTLSLRQHPGDRFVWTIDATPAPIEVETRLVEDRPGELLAWRSVDEAEIDVEIKLQLRDAPAARGTEAEAHVAWRPRWGLAGHYAAWMQGTDPGRLCRQALKRLKMLVETGEIATADNERRDG